MSLDGVIRGCRLPGGDGLVDVGLQDGRIAAILPHVSEEASEEWPARGCLLLPAFVEAHTHLDKCFTLGRLRNRSGTLAEAVVAWSQQRGLISRDDYRRRAEQGIQRAIRHGVTFLRSHVDVGRDIGYRALEVLVELRERYRQEIDVELVALGPLPLNGSRWPEEALAAGADLLGGAPALSEAPERAVAELVERAAERSVGLDLHVDETDDPTSRTLEFLADRLLAVGWQGRATAGHCCSLASMPEADAQRIMEKVKAAGIGIVSLPSCNLVLQGRGDRGPWRRGVTRVKELLALGVPVAFGSDNVQDVFNPFGTFDPLLAAFLGAHACHMSGEEELEESVLLVSGKARSALGKPARSLAVGEPADLVLLRAETMLEAAVSLPTRLAVWRQGRYRRLGGADEDDAFM